MIGVAALEPKAKAWIIVDHVVSPLQRGYTYSDTAVNQPAPPTASRFHDHAPGSRSVHGHDRAGLDRADGRIQDFLGGEAIGAAAVDVLG